MITQALIDRNLKEQATLWMLLDQAAQRGTPAFAPPVVIRCRWETGQARSHTAVLESATVASTVVYVDRDIVDGSRIVKGESAAPTPTEDSRITRSFTATPQLYDPTVVQRTVHL